MLSDTTKAVEWPVDYDYIPPFDESQNDASVGNENNAGSGGNSGEGGMHPGLPVENLPPGENIPENPAPGGGNTGDSESNKPLENDINAIPVEPIQNETNNIETKLEEFGAKMPSDDGGTIIQDSSAYDHAGAVETSSLLSGEKLSDNSLQKKKKASFLSSQEDMEKNKGAAGSAQDKSKETKKINSAREQKNLPKQQTFQSSAMSNIHQSFQMDSAIPGLPIGVTVVLLIVGIGAVADLQSASGSRLAAAASNLMSVLSKFFRRAR